MEFNPSKLWLVFSLALAIGAASGPVAHATQANFTAEGYPAMATILPKQNTELYFETKSDKITCVNNVFETALAAAAQVVTVTPHFSDCVNKNDVSVTIKLNGCHFTFEALTYTKASDTATATAGIKCAKAGERIEVGAFTCAVHIPEQTGLKVVNLTNSAATETTPKPWVTVELDITNLTYTETDGFLCPFEGENHAADGKINGFLEVKGFKRIGDPVAHPTTEGKTAYKEGDFLAVDVR